MRRPRYKGRHPIRPEHKYKELDPTRYANDLDHIRSQGRTPLGTHIPIMAHEVLQYLNPQPGEWGADLTLGYGGHSELFLRGLFRESPPTNPRGGLVCWDQDPLEQVRTQKRLGLLGFSPPALQILPENFDTLERERRRLNLPCFDFIFADLGLSSMQIDQPERGFTLKSESPLDLRMNSTRGQPAREILKGLSVSDFETLLRNYSDEPFPHKIAEVVIAAAKMSQVHTTWNLRDTVLQAVGQIRGYPGDPASAVKRTFQALRIHINDELGALTRMLEQVPKSLAPGGRVAFLTFHSGEDRLVKNFFKKHHLLFSEIAGPLRPSRDEIVSNRRARPAKLRWGRKKGP